ncbi:MAG: sodium-extruding oxaloacetate decarboxylase subunit alpha [Gammaproteobacteria bacterium]
MSKLFLNDVVLRDAHQSLFATRLRLDDMLPIAEQLDDIGYWALETWGGATFDSCIRFLGEDPWVRLRELSSVFKKTPQMMLLRGQNLLGYRHYADDVVYKFVERATTNGMDVFRIFDAMNDVRNLETAIKAVKENGKHAQGTMSYTISDVHSLNGWINMAKQLEDLGCDSICIKDMAGLLQPYVAEKLVKGIKKVCDIPLNLHAHATTGLSTATTMKVIDAGIDIIDTSISTMSLTYGHTPTETIVSIMQGSKRDTGLDLMAFEPIADHFREVRKKYWKFEGELKGVDARILNAQVPGGMLTNMENQLKEQGFGDKFAEVLLEVPRVRADLGYLPLVTPTSQIVGTQAVLNVVLGERYKNITKETRGVLLGEYGATPAPVDKDLQARVIEDGGEVITHRPADTIDPEIDKMIAEIRQLSKDEDFDLAENAEDDALIYALFQQIGLKFLKHRNDPSAFEPVPVAKNDTISDGPETYTVEVDGRQFNAVVTDGGADIQVGVAGAPVMNPDVASEALAVATVSTGESVPITAPLSGNIFKVCVESNQQVQEGDVIIIMEAMKMETEIRSSSNGLVAQIHVKEGDVVTAGQTIITLG